MTTGMSRGLTSTLRLQWQASKEGAYGLAISLWSGWDARHDLAGPLWVGGSEHGAGSW